MARRYSPRSAEALCEHHGPMKPLGPFFELFQKPKSEWSEDAGRPRSQKIAGLEPIVPWYAASVLPHEERGVRIGGGPSRRGEPRPQTGPPSQTCGAARQSEPLSRAPGRLPERTAAAVPDPPPRVAAAPLPNKWRRRQASGRQRGCTSDTMPNHGVLHRRRSLVGLIVHRPILYNMGGRCRSTQKRMRPARRQLHVAGKLARGRAERGPLRTKKRESKHVGSKSYFRRRKHSVRMRYCRKFPSHTKPRHGTLHIRRSRGAHRPSAKS